MLKKILYIFVIVFSLFSCNKNDEGKTLFMHITPELKSFQNFKNIEGKELFVSNFGATSFCIIDTFSIFTTPQLDTLYSISSSQNWKHLGNFVSKGGGNKERIRPYLPMCKVKFDNDILMLLYDNHKANCELFNITQTISKNEPSFYPYNVVLSNVHNIYKIYPMEDSIFFVDYLNAKNISQYYAKIDGVTGNIIEEKMAIESNNVLSLNESYMLATYTDFNIEQKKYVGAMTFVDQINFYDIDNINNSFCITTNKQIKSLLEASRTLMPEKIEYYGELRTTNSYIFALYINQNRKDWSLENKPGTIQVFDWEGNPIIELKTREKIKTFDIDIVNKKLIGMTDDERLYEYNLSFIL